MHVSRFTLCGARGALREPGEEEPKVGSPVEFKNRGATRGTKVPLLLRFPRHRAVCFESRRAAAGDKSRAVMRYNAGLEWRQTRTHPSIIVQIKLRGRRARCDPPIVEEFHSLAFLSDRESLRHFRLPFLPAKSPPRERAGQQLPYRVLSHNSRYTRNTPTGR